VTVFTNAFTPNSFASKSKGGSWPFRWSDPGKGNYDNLEVKLLGVRASSAAAVKRPDENYGSFLEKALLDYLVGGGKCHLKISHYTRT